MMIRKILNQLSGKFRAICLNILFQAFLLLMKVSMILLLCVTTLPCLLLELIFGNDDILEKYKTITANFHEQRATDY